MSTSEIRRPVNCKKCGRVLLKLDKEQIKTSDRFEVVVKCQCGVAQKIVVRRTYSIEVHFHGKTDTTAE